MRVTPRPSRWRWSRARPSPTWPQRSTGRSATASGARASGGRRLGSRASASAATTRCRTATWSRSCHEVWRPGSTMLPMLYELRQYRAQPGRRDDLARFMEEVIIPFQTSKGVVIVASFVGEKEDDLYVWIRRFEDEAERERLYEAVYQSDRWKNEIAPAVGALLDRPRMVITRLSPTPKSILH